MADSDWMDVAEAVQAILKAAIGSTAGPAYQAALTDPPASSVTINVGNFFIRKFPWDSRVDHPGVFLLPAPEQIAQSTNLTDDWGHAIEVGITQISNRSLTSDHDRLHFLRELSIGQFLSQRIAALPAYYVTVEPKGLLDPRAFAANYDLTSFILRCTKRKLRPTQASP